ncbi:MAG: GAF domain-containing protein [Magnetococcales bacterium]|nr:GAF domain-containing protein [Magnetococcales bacterium]
MSEIKKILEWNKQLQGIINSALSCSLEPLTLEEHLEAFLELILTLPDMAFHARGGIFLANSEGDTLNLVVHHDMPQELLENCAQIPFGYCICGRTAEMGEIFFIDCMDRNHQFRYQGMEEHGHYCVPIRSNDRVLGVINLYVPDGHIRKESVEGVLTALAAILAGVIIRKRGEDALLKVQRELSRVSGHQSNKVIFSLTILNRIISAWKKIDSNKREKPPRLEHLRILLDAIYYASLYRKEDQAIQLNVTLLRHRSELSRISRSDVHVLFYEKVMPLRVDSLVALAPSFDYMNTTLIVIPAEDEPDDLEIIGVVCFSGEDLYRFNANTFSCLKSSWLSVAVKEPGNLNFFRGYDSVGKFSSDRFIISNATRFTESPLAWNLVKELRNHPEFDQLDMLYWDVYQNFIDRLLLAISSAGHGGAVIWLPLYCQQQAFELMDPRFPLKAAPEASSSLARFAQLESWVQSNRDTHGRHAKLSSLLAEKHAMTSLIDLLANLTRVDGALVLSDRLSPMVFGAMLHAKIWTGQIVSWDTEPIFPSIHLDFKKLGARHASAVNFIGQCPGAVAFVVSQDGPVAGLTYKDEQSIYWWPDCLGRLWKG